ncbi:MAG TPA: PIN domain-containing protein [Candidatus Acidoferrales bacterium]|nr:PIN domain-containing protein [Candidatus Acidoferrales bacterium]
MNYLLDVSTLIALLLDDHVHNKKVTAWAAGKKLAICPLSELGFLRVAMKAYNATPDQSRRLLKSFKDIDRPQFVPADISALEGDPFPSAGKSTDWYIANLAQKHGMKWATLDKGANHPARALVE